MSESSWFIAGQEMDHVTENGQSEPGMRRGKDRAMSKPIGKGPDERGGMVL
jgi:hypothetical protein